MQLITGSSGFIGTNIIKKLGTNLVIEFDLEDNMDVRNKDQIFGACIGKEVEVIHHLAAILGTPETFDYPIQQVIGVNIIGTINILKLAKWCNAKVVYPGMLRIWHNPYSITKGCGQDFVQMYHKHYGVPTTILTLTNAYGPGQRTEPYKKIIPTFVMAALRNEPLPVAGSGGQTVDLIHVEDVAKAFILAGDSWESNGKEIEIGTGVEMKVYDVAQKVIDMCGSESTIKLIPLRRGEDKFARIKVDTGDAWRYLGFEPEIEFEEGMVETIKYYEEINNDRNRLLDANN